MTLLVGLGLALTIPDAPAGAPAQLLVATNAQLNTPWADHIARVKTRAEGATDGELAYRAFFHQPSSEVELLLACVGGEDLQGVMVSTSTLAVVLDLPLLLLPELPYLFEDLDEVDLIMDELLFDLAAEALLERGLVLGAWSEAGWRSIGSSAPAVVSPEALSGRTLRAQPDHPLQGQTLRAMGSSRPEELPASELRSRLRAHVVAGFDATPFSALVTGWVDQVEVFTLTQHAYQPAALVYSAASLDALGAAHRASVLGDRRVDAAETRAEVRALNAQVLEAMREKGVDVITPEDLTPFVEATRAVHEAFLNEHASLRPIYNEVMETLQARRSTRGPR